MNPPPDADLQTRLVRLEAELALVRNAARRRRQVTLAAPGVLAFAGTIGTALAANGNCPNGLPFCFGANQPAVASEVNHNFAQLKEWLEAKAGPVTAGGFTTGSGTFTSGLTTGTLSTTGAGTVSGLLTGNGGLTVNNGVVTANAGIVANNFGITSNAGLTVNGAVIFSGYQVSCFEGVSGFGFPSCCRIDIRTGATQCRYGQNWQSTAFVATASDPFAAGTEGHYSLSCFMGINNVNFPTCCRGNSAGSVTCRNANDWQLSSWGTSGTAF